jgi:hypothetical protein
MTKNLFIQPATRKQQTVFPEKTDVCDWLYYLNTARRKEKNKDKLRKIKMIIEEFKTLKEIL